MKNIIKIIDMLKKPVMGSISDLYSAGSSKSIRKTMASIAIAACLVVNLTLLILQCTIFGHDLIDGLKSPLGPTDPARSPVECSIEYTDTYDINATELPQLTMRPGLIVSVLPYRQSSIRELSTYSSTFEATAYTDGGLTATGFDLTGHSWDSARIIAVDPYVIPLGSQVYVEFDDEWSDHNGVYTAADTGGAIYGNIIDVFVGHGEDSLAWSFGRRTVYVKVLGYE